MLSFIDCSLLSENSTTDGTTFGTTIDEGTLTGIGSVTLISFMSIFCRSSLPLTSPFSKNFALPVSTTLGQWLGQ